MLTLHMPPDLESRLRDEAAREGLAPDAFIVRAVERALRTNGPMGATGELSSRESELLGKIGIGLSDEEWRRYRELRSKSDADTLTAPERTEILAMADRIERANAARMGYMVELAALRRVPLEQLMDQLGLGNGMETGGELSSG